jgi:hypothetical protein
MSSTNSKHNWLAFGNLIALLGLIYLILIPTGVIKKDNRLAATDAGIIVILTLIGSGVIERIKEVEFDKDGLKLTLEEKLETLEKKVEANKTVNQREAEVLSIIAKSINPNEETKAKISDTLVAKEELDILNSLNNAEINHTKFTYDKEKFSQNLRQLLALNFIKYKTETKKCFSTIPNGSDLTKYVTLTDYGKELLSCISERLLKVNK